MDRTFKVSINVDILNDDGSPFFTNHVHWENMDYAGMVLIERKLIDVLSDLVAEAEQDVAEAIAAAQAPVPSATA